MWSAARQLRAALATERFGFAPLSTGLLALAWVASACGGSSSQDDSALDVFAAASLGDVTEALIDTFTSQTGADLRLNVAGSSTLRLQIDEGAGADVFLSADAAQLDLLAAPTAGSPVVVATNRLVSAHHVDAQPIGIERFDDSDLLLGACAPSVPCGAYAEEAFSIAGVAPSLDTLEPDVRSLASKIAERELDAGLVYETDVFADERLAGVELLEPVLAAYPAVRLAEGDQPDLAIEFLDFLVSADAREVFAEYGFGAP